MLLGALLMQTVENGLVSVNADPYLYPTVMATVIFVAVLLDSLGAKAREWRAADSETTLQLAGRSLPARTNGRARR